MTLRPHSAIVTLLARRRKGSSEGDSAFRVIKWAIVAAIRHASGRRAGFRGSLRITAPSWGGRATPHRPAATPPDPAPNPSRSGFPASTGIDLPQFRSRQSERGPRRHRGRSIFFRPPPAPRRPTLATDLRGFLDLPGSHGGRGRVRPEHTCRAASLALSVRAPGQRELSRRAGSRHARAGEPHFRRWPISARRAISKPAHR